MHFGGAFKKVSLSGAGKMIKLIQYKCSIALSWYSIVLAPLNLLLPIFILIFLEKQWRREVASIGGRGRGDDRREAPLLAEGV